ncbi:hypothetical protein [Paenibacillus sp. GYB003]|uniref:hypothetical protein n=1 Tax=Paenibacillus sp. GYB003 TaxID=2994392 RepID=UPI002F9694AD
MNESIKRIAMERALSRDRQADRDWSAEMKLLETRVRDLRRAAATNPGRPDAERRDGDAAGQAPNPGAGKSLLESLAYAQTVQIKQDRPKRNGRRSWRPEAFEPTLGADLMPDGGSLPRRGRGDG